MHANDSVSLQTDKYGYVQIVEESMIYDTLDGEKISRRPTDNLPPPPMPVVLTVSNRESCCDPYKQTTILPNNEVKENEERNRTWNKTRHVLGILVVLLVVVTSVAISVPIALHYHYTLDVNRNFTENPSTSSQSTTDSSSGVPEILTTSVIGTTPEILTTQIIGTTPEILTTQVIVSTPAVLTTPEIETTLSDVNTVRSTTTTQNIPTLTVSTDGCRPTSPNKCHSCTCSDPIRCPVNGQITISEFNEKTYQQFELCDGPCFTEVRGSDNNKTHRGCASKDWKWRSTDHDLGCLTTGLSRVCFCCGEYCNNYDMTNYAQTHSCN